MTVAPFPERPKQLEFTHNAARGGNRIVVNFIRGKNSLVGYYDGDLAYTGKAGTREMVKTPLNEVYVCLLRDFIAQCAPNLGTDNPVAGVVGILNTYSQFAKYGREVYAHSKNSICTDGSRLTTAMSLANNYLLTLAHICRLLHVDGKSSYNPVVTIDENYGGLETIDAHVIPFGVECRPEISRTARQDLSRGPNYLAAREDGYQTDSRMQLFEKLLAGKEVVDGRTPNSVYTPVADAFRTSQACISKVILEAVQMLRENVLSDDQERDEAI